MRKCFVLSILVFAFALSIQAEPISYTQVAKNGAPSQVNHSSLRRSTVMSTEEYNALTPDTQKQRAGIFNLKPKEYKTFLHYMNDTMDGFEYDQNINPNLVLAMHTQDSSQYKTYLKNVARADHQAVSQLLRVSIDYPRILKELYPREKPVMTPAMRASMNNKLGAGDVVQLFCRPGSAVCSNLLGVIKAPILTSGGARLDIFFVGKLKREDIVVFAKANAITPQEVMAHHITLNFGNDVFSKLQKQTEQKLPLPYLLVRRNGTSIPVNLGGKNA